MQYIRRALAAVEADIGIEHALAPAGSTRKALGFSWSTARTTAVPRCWPRLLTRNWVFTGVVKQYLERITFAEDGWAPRLTLPVTERPVVRVDPRRGSGQPLTIKGGARVVDVVDRFRGGESPDFIAEDFEVPVKDVLDIIRAFYTPVPAAA